MGFFEALHAGLRRVETAVDRGLSPGRLGDWLRRVGDRISRGDVGPIVVFGAFLTLALMGAATLPIVIPFVLVLALILGLIQLARIWGREFLTLMRLDDGAFPGRHDKLIWGLLLILIPPVGAWLFGAYREAHWGVGKAEGPAAEV
ncbi:hypothetical protein TA3x_001965 [Tundrisphaera sp. TA3]|uniref:hypothetical protein n=1 Tax=Tundrisphaera sp. TA3 TaxID=3435775 RepID=UPI003EBE01B4